MLTTSAPNDFSDSLRTFWNESVQHHAVAFLRQAIDETAPLTHVVAALQYLEGEGVVLATRQLNGIWAEALMKVEIPQEAPVKSTDYKSPLQPPANPVPTPALETGTVSSNSLVQRTSADTERLKTRLVRQLVGTTAPQTVDELTRALRLSGDIVNASEMDNLLASLREEGRVDRHPDKARAWIFRPQGQRQAQGMVIRRAAERTSLVDSFTEASRRHTLPLRDEEQPGEFMAAHKSIAVAQANTSFIAPAIEVAAQRPVDDSLESATSTAMRALGKPATASERAQSQNMLLQLAQQRGLPLQRAKTDAPDELAAADVTMPELSS